MHSIFVIYTATTDFYPLSLHDALPISRPALVRVHHTFEHAAQHVGRDELRSEEHTSELQSHVNLVCRLLLEKKRLACPYHRSSFDAVQASDLSRLQRLQAFGRPVASSS